MRMYLKALAMALNQLANAMLGGDPDMSVSARAAYARENGSTMGAGVCHVLDWLDPHDGDGPQGNHCDGAIRDDLTSGR